MSVPATSLISTLPACDPAEAHIGERRPSAGISAVEIDGEYYWDGVVSNTPLQWVLDNTPRQNTGIPGRSLERARLVPGNVAQVETRRKEINIQADAGWNRCVQICTTHACVIAALLEKLPDELKEAGSQDLGCCRRSQSLQHHSFDLSRAQLRGHAKDYEFSRVSMEPLARGLATPARFVISHFGLPANDEGVVTFDGGGRE